MRLVFIGWYGRRNCGDEAFQAVHQHLFPNIEKVWLEKCHGFEFQDNDVVILGGGDVLMPYYVDAIPADRKFFVYGCGLADSRSIDYVASLSPRIHGIWLRNEADVAALRKRGVAASFTPDIFFQLAPSLRETGDPFPTEKRLVFAPSNNHFRHFQRTGNIKDFSYMNYFMYEMAGILDYLAEFYHIDFVSMSMDNNDDDPAFANTVYGLMTRRHRVTLHEYSGNPIKIFRTIQNAKLCISMKYHGLVFALTAGTPFINVGLARKTQLFCSENGFDDVSVPVRSLEYSRFLDVVKTAEQPSFLERMHQTQRKFWELATQEGRRFKNELLQQAQTPQPTIKVE